MPPRRAEVWDARIPGISPHPFVILSANAMIVRLGSVTAALVTSTAGPPETHIQLGGEYGLNAESYANATDLHTIPTARLRRRRGRLAPGELGRLDGAVRTYLGLGVAG